MVLSPWTGVPANLVISQPIPVNNDLPLPIQRSGISPRRVLHEGLRIHTGIATEKHKKHAQHGCCSKADHSHGFFLRLCLWLYSWLYIRANFWYPIAFPCSISDQAAG